MRFARLFSLSALLASAPLLWASGSFPPSAPRNPAAAARPSLDNAKFNLGKAIFARELKFDPEQPAELSVEEFNQQDETLALLMAKLPKRATVNNDLTELAGLLTMPQFEALKYFLGIRFRVTAN